jgi:hypothetical protein
MAQTDGANGTGAALGDSSVRARSPKVMAFDAGIAERHRRLADTLTAKQRVVSR